MSNLWREWVGVEGRGVQVGEQVRVVGSSWRGRWRRRWLEIVIGLVVLITIVI